MHRRTIAQSAAALSALLLVSACAPSDDAPDPDAETVAEGTAGADGECTGEQSTLKVWSWRTEDADTYEQIFDVFEGENPCITVDFQAFLNTEYNQILSTGLTGTDGPDIAQVRSYGQLQPLIESGNLVALDDIVPEVREFDETILAGALGREDGQVYGVPFASQTLQMYYNVAVFEELGLEEPETWEDFVAANEAIAESGMTPMAVGALDAWMLPIVHDILSSAQYGGSEFEEAVLSGEAQFTDPQYVASIQTLKDMQPFMSPDVVGVSYTDSQVLFTSEQAAMFPGGSFELAFFQEQNPDLELGVFQVPPAPEAVLEEAVTPAYADGNWGMNANGTQTEAAETLIAWLATQDFGQMVADDLKQFSPVPGVEFSDPLMSEMWEMYQESPAPYLHLVNFRYGEPLGTDLMGQGAQELLLGDKDPAQVAADIQGGLSEWFTPGQ
ncbi:ABC transporter substrate-binding protein [Georgenia faecalis]|uniref:ABC transporter substrate-binding protein n=1 Tax=Georgenia faecalis TaxID=2483799 RepID=A0ABV9DA05_9MICO|nr:extracellular solute-binding protein [Georgenia faecalis]